MIASFRVTIVNAIKSTQVIPLESEVLLEGNKHYREHINILKTEKRHIVIILPVPVRLFPRPSRYRTTSLTRFSDVSGTKFKNLKILPVSRDPKWVDRDENWGLGTRQSYSYFIIIILWRRNWLLRELSVFQLNFIAPKVSS